MSTAQNDKKPKPYSLPCGCKMEVGRIKSVDFVDELRCEEHTRLEMEKLEQMIRDGHLGASGRKA